MLRGEEMQMWRLIGVVARCNCAAVPQSRPFQQLEAGMRQSLTILPLDTRVIQRVQRRNLLQAVM